MIVFPDKTDVFPEWGGGGAGVSVCVSKTEMGLTNMGSKGRFETVRT